MRRPLFMLPTALAALAAVAALGCEDGPAQTYTASPPDAGSIWNSGNVPLAAADAGQQFDAGYPVQSKTVLCDSDFKRQRWAWMLTQPINPPRGYAGIDLAGGDQWPGLTIEAAEAAPATPTSTTGGLCQSVPVGYQGICPSDIGFCNGSYWGNNGEVQFSWNVATHLLDYMNLNLGYTGGIETNAYPSADGSVHKWTIAIGDVIRRDSLPYNINWADIPTARLQITDMYNAIMATFAPSAGVPFNTGSCMKDDDCTTPGAIEACMCANKTGGVCGAAGQCGFKNCGTDGNCLVYNDGVNTIMGFRPMVVYVVGNSGVPQPQLSTPIQIYNFFSKWEPFSNLPQVVKLDAEGPVAQGTPAGVPSTASTYCTQSIGLSFKDFRQNCVEVSGIPMTDSTNLAKVTHSLVHDQEHWTSSVLGVNQNFTSTSVANNPNIVVQDNDTPQDGDIAQDFTFDVRARGYVANDFAATCAANTDCKAYSGATCSTEGYCVSSTMDYHLPGNTPTLQGTALVFIEFARLLLADIARVRGTETTVLGDPRCVGISGGVPNYETSTTVAANGQTVPLCSGMEGLMIPNAATSYGGSALAVDFSQEPGVDCTTPNDPTNPACLDPGINADSFGDVYQPILKPGAAVGLFCVDPATMSDCTNNQGFSLWQVALVHMTRVLGNGDVLNLPSELRDRRYFFKWFGIAYVKYLKAYGAYAKAYGNNVTHFPNGKVGGGIGPTDVKNTFVDIESLFFDNYLAAGTFDKFEYIDRDFQSTGNGGDYNWVPWDFEYGCDLFGGNQKYDNWYRRMDREEIALFQTMLTDKTHWAGQENNVNITNLFGSIVLAGDQTTNTSGIWPSYACAVGQAGDPVDNCVNCNIVDGTHNNCVIANAPLDPLSAKNLAGCNAATPSGCAAGEVCGGGWSFTNGWMNVCGVPCDFAAHPATGCADPTAAAPHPQTCAFNLETGQESCADMALDANGMNAKTPTPMLARYPGAWTGTPFSYGHSSITLQAGDKHPEIGVAGANLPNYVWGPYVASPVAADSKGNCPASPVCVVDADCGSDTCNTGTGFCNAVYAVNSKTGLCEAPLNTGTDCGVVNPPSIPGTPACNKAPGFKTLIPWFEVQPGVGFSIPLDGQHSQWLATGQLDFTGVLETYIVDYIPWVDTAKSSCVTDSTCNKGYTCDLNTDSCVASDGSIRIEAIEGQDFLGQIFPCYDPLTFDVLGVRMYDSAQGVVDWLAAHPGGETGYGPVPSAQAACNMLVIRSSYNNFIDQITSKAFGIQLNINGGTGQGRVTDVVAFDPALVQNL